MENKIRFENDLEEEKEVNNIFQVEQSIDQLLPPNSKRVMRSKTYKDQNIDKQNFVTI